MQKSSKLFLSLIVLSGMVLSACGGAEGVEELIENQVEGEVDLEFDEEDGKSGEDEEDDDDDEEMEEEPTMTEPVEEEEVVEETPSASKTVSTTGSYQSPAGPESIVISMELSDGVITGVTVVPQADNETSLKLQNRFSDGIAAEIVGMELAELDGVSAVGGASLTANGFNSALAELKAQAS